MTTLRKWKVSDGSFSFQNAMAAGWMRVVTGLSFLLCGIAFGQVPDTVLQAPNPPDNAALLYYRAFLLVSPLTDKENGGEDEAFWQLVREDNYDVSKLDPFLERNANALTVLLQASAIEHCDFGVQFDQGGNALLPELARARDLSKLGIIAMRQATDTSQWDRALDLYAAVLRLAQGTSEKGTVISALVSAAIVDNVNSQMGHLLSALPPKENFLERLDSTLTRITPGLINWAAALDGEMKIQAVCTPAQLMRFSDMAAQDNVKEHKPSAEVLEHIIQGTSSQEEREQVAQFIQCTPEDLTSPEKISAMLTRYGKGTIQMLKEIQTALALPYPDAKPQMAAIMKRTESGNPFDQVVYADKFAFHKAKVETQLAMVRVASAVLRWRNLHATLPQTLAVLPPGLPMDPFTDNQPFEYQPARDGGFSLTGKGTEKFTNSTPLVLTVPAGVSR